MGHLDLGPSSAKEGPEDASPGVQAVGAVIWDGEAGLCFTWNIYLFLGGEIGLLDKH